MLTFNTKDTETITKTYALLQKINMIVCGIIALASLILTFVIATEDEVLWLIPVIVLIVTAIVFCAIYILLQIKFGMYYDIRVTRLATEKKKNSANAYEVDDALPEL